MSRHIHSTITTDYLPDLPRPRMLISIGFHDVVDDASFVGVSVPGHTTVYTLERRRFERHLSHIRHRTDALPVRRIDQLDLHHRGVVLLTVDDGKESAFTYVAPELEKHGWRGHFFVTTNWIGRPGYLDRRQIRELQERGHVIGSHSCTHPERMSSLSWDELLKEWGNSCAQLSDIIGQTVTVASVPNGYYSRKVGCAAAASGIRVLFTSEPTATASFMNGCLVLGRFSVRRSTLPSAVAAVAAGSKWPRHKQAAIWFANNTVKRITGKWYIPLRRVLLDVISQ